MHYLVVPRFLACVLLIPLLTVMADFMGVMGGALICIRDLPRRGALLLAAHRRRSSSMWDVVTGLIKPMFFGARHRADLAATAASTARRAPRASAGPPPRRSSRRSSPSWSLDFFLAMFLNNLHDLSCGRSNGSEDACRR